jgi:DNA replication protein DnaC
MEVNRMKRQSINLRQAFASHPTRFLASVSRLPIELQPSRRALVASQSTEVHADPIFGKLRRLGLQGMVRALAQQKTDPIENVTSFTKWLTLLVEDEISDRRERRIAGRLRSARLRYNASTADLDYNVVRGFDDALFHRLATGQWIADRENVIIEGPTGVGKTWLACALGEAACRDDHSVRYERIPKLFAELASMRGTGGYSRRTRALQKVELLILDDWGIEPLGPEERHDTFEILEYRYGRGSTLIASPVPIERWSQSIGDPTVAAMALDRIVHNAHRLHLRGESLRSRKARHWGSDPS